jgi:N-methylhydantoinase A
MYWLGVDVGGTFTDLVLYDVDAGTLRTAKTPTTPNDPGRGVLEGLAAVGIGSSGSCTGRRSRPTRCSRSAAPRSA